ncbi:mannose-1-phosphate guanylyltransferase [Aurantiacibacter gangjinensis]|uniref:Mannose-1-phosphate guanylyltransferase n=1 Tax=Aurantiacibacter gangjinensis TaxID=502682 RepID=A0A0G9MMG3_9SPHN|nr:sugar phosphate nucleotidyltransferase [Aurantiacibacter gangjinensis]APE27814.1 Mannose-1-phosphate guanylyltransferase (GDP) [Aurantiacibacter gangjinensis]KLE31799.1 mannose-1-phosphate guanylyltransferase [Aurantiacibacter gangjinensis]
MSLIHPVILCGGSGTRLWPRSRKDKPKPFLPLVGDQTLFQQTVARTTDAALFAAPTIVTGAAHAALVEEQLPDGGGVQIIVEPSARNTAAAIALAALRLPEDAVMLVCPSDHYIADIPAFHAATEAAMRLAAQDYLVAFGITPTQPETGFGYIRSGAALDGGMQIAEFVEKPDIARATQFLADGNYSWNGGIFAFRAGHFLKELASHRPELARHVRRSVESGSEDGARFHPDAQSFAAITPESVDYAVMENTGRAAMVPVSMGWSDIGNWHALHDARQKDAHGNSATGEVELLDCTNVLVETDGPRISAIGLSDIAIVIDGDEVLVTTMEGAQRVGKLGGAKSQ